MPMETAPLCNKGRRIERRRRDRSKRETGLWGRKDAFNWLWIREISLFFFTVFLNITFLTGVKKKSAYRETEVRFLCISLFVFCCLNNTEDESLSFFFNQAPTSRRGLFMCRRDSARQIWKVKGTIKALMTSGWFGYASNLEPEIQFYVISNNF